MADLTEINILSSVSVKSGNLFTNDNHDLKNILQHGLS
jgi:hypothetical protein